MNMFLYIDPLKQGLKLLARFLSLRDDLCFYT